MLRLRIAHLKNNRFVVLEEIDKNGNVFFLDPKIGHRSCTLDSFGGMWSGIILRVNLFIKANIDEYKSNRRKEIFISIRNFFIPFGWLFVGIMAIICGLPNVENASTILLLLTVKFTGLILCIILSISCLNDFHLLKKFCRIGKRADCIRVLNSPFGKIFDVSMSDIGMIYFSGGIITLILLFYLNNIEFNLFLLFALNILTIPYTFFSIIYQAFIIHSWCWMCLITQVLFWIEFYILFDLMSYVLSKLTCSLPIPFIIGFSIPTLIWIVLRPLIIKSKKADNLELELLRIRRNPKFIEELLYGAKKFDMGDFSNEFEIGHSNAEITLTLVVNPLCPACKNTFRQFSQLIKLGYGKIKGIIRFCVFIKDSDKSATEKFLNYEVSVIITAIALSGELKVAQNALYNWFYLKKGYGKRKFNKWRSKFNNQTYLQRKKAEICLKSYYDWAKSASINSIPTIFFNSKKIPHGIQLEDLKFFLLRKIKD